MYSGYGIVFDSSDSWSFNNDTPRNVIIFYVNDNSSSHADNCKNNVLVLSEGPTLGINGSFGWPEKKFSINFSKAKNNYAWVCVIMLIIVISFLIGLKLTIKMLIFKLHFVLEAYLMDLMLLSLEKYVWMEMYLTFQSITGLTNLTY